MSCILDNFNQRFPNLKGDNINLSSNSELNEIIQWIEAANAKAFEQGFNAPLFEIDWKRKKNPWGHTYMRDNYGPSQPYLIIHQNNHVLYEEFINNVLIPELQYSQDLDERLFSSFESDINLSEEALLTQENYENNFSYTDLLYSPMTYDHTENTNSIFDEPVNFREWKETRIKLLESLNNTKNKFLNKKENKNKLKQINTAIKNIELELQEFDDTNPNYVHENVINEIDSLNNLLNLVNDDPVNSANILDTNLVRERIEDLKLSQYSESFENGDAYNFHSGLNTEQVNEISKKVTDLDNKYRKSLENLIFNIITNNELVLQHKEHFREEGREQEFVDFINRAKELLDPENNDFKIDGDSLFGKNFLGAGSYDSLLAEIVIVTRDINKSKEAGITNLWRKQLKDSYDKIKNIKEGDNFFTDRLFQKDEFGIKNQKLINYITPDFFKKIKILSAANKDFYIAKSNQKSSSYKDWMTLNKMNIDYIEPYKIQSFVNKYKDNPDFSEFFTFSPQEMNQYENELREKLGNAAFELELEKQIDSVTDYLNDEFATTIDKYHKNPLRFLKNFYSDNFDKYDQSTGDFLIPTYLKYIPLLSNKEYFNQEFKEIESLNIDGFKDFYISAKNLLDYIRETARTEGLNVNFNDIISLRDSAGREAKKNLSTFGGMWLDVKTILKSLFSEFYEGRLENLDNDKNYKRKFNTHYSNYGFREIDEMTSILSAKSISELTVLANKEGITIPDKFKEDTIHNRGRIANAISKNRINKSISLDLFKRISYGASLAESMNTRRGTLSILNLVKDYGREYDTKNTNDFLNVWEANNILQTGYLNHEKIGKFERVKVKPLPKIYTEAELEIKKLYEAEKQNIDKNYNFHYDGIKYFKELNKYYKEDVGTNKKEIIKDEIDKIYEKYISDKISELGKDARVGTVMFGLAWNMFRSYLWASLPSGLKNRLAGYNQNNEAAASQLHGFSMDNLVNARRLLGGTNIRKTLNYTGIPQKIGIPQTHKAQQVEILLNLVESLGLLENVMNDIDAGDGSGSFIGQNKYNKFKEIMSDFAMNNPEFHNQMEILVAIMQNVNLEKVDGSKGKLYDPKTRSFPFDVKTMRLLPEFRTENNIKNWEQFIADDSGKAPQNLLIQNFTTILHKLHGNYNSDDKIGIQSTMTGRGLTAFMKWAYENYNNQYGTKKISLATAQIDIKGRKIPLLSNFPLLATHFALQNVGIPSIVGTTIGLATGTTPIVLGGIGVVNAGILGYFIYKNKKNIKFSWDDFGTSFNHLKEVLLRTVKTSTLTTTRGLINPISDDAINKLINRDRATYKDRNLDFKTRQLISESAQEVANKYNMAIQFMIMGLVLKGLYTLAASSLGDDEEEKLKKLKTIEGNLKFLVNIKNSMTAEIEKWTNIAKIKETYGEVILLRFIMDSYNKIIEAPKRYNEGKISEEEMYYNLAEGLSGPLLGIPRQLLKISKPGTSLYSDDRIYDNQSKTWADDYLLNSHLTGEAKYSPLVKQERSKLRKELEGIYRRKIRDAFDEQNRDDYYNIDELVKENITSLFKRSNIDKDKDKTYESIYKNTDWNSILEKAKNGTPSLQKKQKSTERKTVKKSGRSRKTRQK